MASGRKPKPVSQKLLAGNPGKRKLNSAEPKFSEITNIDPPEWLDDLASQMWQRIIPELLKEKVLCSTDLHNVECFCVAYSRWRQSEQDVVKYGIVVESGNGSLTKNPALTAANLNLKGSIDLLEKQAAQNRTYITKLEDQRAETSKRAMEELEKYKNVKKTNPTVNSWADIKLPNGLCQQTSSNRSKDGLYQASSNNPMH